MADHEAAWTGAVKSLTSREREVFDLLGRGLSNKEIAAALGIKLRTSRAHVESILRKLGVESRLQAGLVAAAHGPRRRRPPSAGGPSADEP